MSLWTDVSSCVVNTRRRSLLRSTDKIPVANEREVCVRELLRQTYPLTEPTGRGARIVVRHANLLKLTDVINAQLKTTTKSVNFVNFQLKLQFRPRFTPFSPPFRFRFAPVSLSKRYRTPQLQVNDVFSLSKETAMGNLAGRQNRSTFSPSVSGRSWARADKEGVARSVLRCTRSQIQVK